MPKRYTQAERDFVLALTLATKKPFRSLEPVLQGLATQGMLAWLGPGANERFRNWPYQRGYAWAKRYGWQLNPLEVDDQPPLPAEEEIDDQLLRDRLKVKEHFLERLMEKVGNAYQNSKAFDRVTQQVENQIVRRMSRPLTPQTIIDLVFNVIGRLEGRQADETAVLQAITEEVNRYRYLPAGETS